MGNPGLFRCKQSRYPERKIWGHPFESTVAPHRNLIIFRPVQWNWTVCHGTPVIMVCRGTVAEKHWLKAMKVWLEIKTIFWQWSNMFYLKLGYACSCISSRKLETSWGVRLNRSMPIISHIKFKCKFWMATLLIKPFKNWFKKSSLHVIGAGRCCISENHLRVAAAAAVFRRSVPAGAEGQRLRVSGFLAQVWRFHGDHRRSRAHRRQLLLLEENAQVGLQVLFAVCVAENWSKT